MWKRAPLFLILSTILLLGGCVGLSGDSVQNEVGQPFNAAQLPAQEELPKFSAETARNGMPNGWNFYRIAPFKKNTVYRLESLLGFQPEVDRIDDGTDFGTGKISRCKLNRIE